MILLKEKISNEDLKKMQPHFFQDMVKAVVDVDREWIALNAQLHSDLEALLLDQGSCQDFLWGINLYPDAEGDDFVEFHSMINVRPSQGNKGRGVENPETQKRILQVVRKWITR